MANTPEITNSTTEPEAVKKRIVKKKVVAKTDDTPKQSQKKVTNTEENIVTPKEVKTEKQSRPKTPKTKDPVPIGEKTVSQDTVSTSTKKGGKNSRKPKRIIQDLNKLSEQLTAHLALLDETDPTSKAFVRVKKALHKTALGLNEASDYLQNYIRRPSKSSGSGFMKKVPITEDLKNFGIKYGGWDRSSCDMMSRVDATKAICAHIQQGGLFDEKDKRNIRVSTDMRRLLNLSDECTVTTYPLIQKGIQIHFSPKDAVVV